jgi:biopolymer transport protein ExbD
MTVLIFFFLMTMHFEEMQALAITPPIAESAGKEKSAGGPIVAVTKSGEFYLNGKTVEKDVLVDTLRKTGEKTPGGPILIVADEQTLTKDTVFIVDQANKAGLSPKLVTRPSR